MTKNNKGRDPGKDATPKTFNSRNHSEVDPLIVWLNLDKPSRDRQKNRGWQRGTRL